MIDLTEFDEYFASTKIANGSDFDDVPDGTYQVVIDEICLDETKETGKPMLKWTLKILGPKFVGRLLWKNQVITRESIPYLKKDLLTCGLNLPRLSALADNLEYLWNLKLEVVKKTTTNKRDGKEYSNIFINKKITLKTSEDESPYSNDRLPF